MPSPHFDQQAAGWDDHPDRIENARQIAGAIKKEIPLSKTMSALEFGCGTGLVSRELLPALGKITAVDISPGMIEQLQKRINENGLLNITARCLDIFVRPPAGSFDLIFSAMALHHVPETDLLLDVITARIAPGGFIALADLDTEDGTFHERFEGFIHHGLDRNELIKKLRARGFVEIAVITAHTMHKNGRDYPVFLITARKPAA